MERRWLLAALGRFLPLRKNVISASRSWQQSPEAAKSGARPLLRPEVARHEGRKGSKKHTPKCAHLKEKKKMRALASICYCDIAVVFVHFSPPLFLSPRRRPLFSAGAG